MREYPETHQHGAISIENVPKDCREGQVLEGDFGIQIARDGRVWVCINGLAFIRFKPVRKEVKYYAIFAVNIREIVGVTCEGDIPEENHKHIEITKAQFDAFGEDPEDKWHTYKQLVAIWTQEGTE